ncbi:uncharacterized protein LOC133460307 isoform X3 [Cololabis saira]|uniref:uncharacterized protein LOC133460307 isoform X3 n=1 Tax=Cololabis saira TaxID=129043 RepID=UPI002AD45430|nr:uncharacterized protein LOC133460307 isoform X3 [Cololabis saira]
MHIFLLIIFTVALTEAAAMKMVLLVFLLTLIAAACPLMVKEKYVKAGDMLVLYCGEEQCKNGDSVTVWKKDTDQETFLFNTSAAEQKHMGILVFGNCFMILNASANHQGNYSCDSRRKTNRHMEFMVTVYTAQSKQYEERNQYPMTCCKQHSCTLDCPHDLAVDAPNITSRCITWERDGEPSPSYFPSVGEKHHGVYTCTRPYLYAGQIYNRTFIVPLNVKEEVWEKSQITSPQDKQVFQVDLGTTGVINCEAITDSCDNLLFWLSNGSFVADDNSTRVFNNDTCSSYLGPESHLLSVIHKAPVERQTLLFFIITEQTEASTSSAFPEALHLPSIAGDVPSGASERTSGRGCAATSSPKRAPKIHS